MASRYIYLIVLNDGTDEIFNIHVLMLMLDPEVDAYTTVRKAFVEAYGDEDYYADEAETINAYRAMPPCSLNHEGYYASTIDVDVEDDEGVTLYGMYEVVDDPLSRTFLILPFDPDDGTSRTGVVLNGKPATILDMLSEIPNIEHQFLPLSKVLRLLDIYRMVSA